MGYTGLGSALLQHVVTYCFLLYSFLFTQCLLNYSAEEQQVLFSPFKKALLFNTQNHHYFSFNISLSESNLRKRQSSLIDACCCHGYHIKGQMRAGQTITSGWKRWNDQMQPSVYLMSYNVLIISVSSPTLILKWLDVWWKCLCAVFSIKTWEKRKKTLSIKN